MKIKISEIKTSHLEVERYKIYKHLEDFKNGYIIDFSKLNQEITFLEYLSDLRTIYETLQGMLKPIRIKMNLSEIILNNVKTGEKLNTTAQNPIDLEVTKDEEVYGVLNRFYSINSFIIKQIEDEKINILRFQNNNNQTQTIEVEPLTAKQVQKIGLLIRSGIVDFLKEKNPKISDNQIAGFLSLISDGTMKQSSINPNLKKENKNYPIKNQQDKNDLDYILEKYGINPQSE